MESSEELREALVSLQKENERLRCEVEQAGLLSGAFESLLRVGIDDDPFASVFESLRNVFTFQHVMVLAEDEDGDGHLACIAASPRALVGCRVRCGRFFRKVMDGRVSITFSNRDIEEWQDLPHRLVSPDQPALYLPIRVRERRGVLALLRRTGGEGFDRSHVALAQKFSILASHALAASHTHRLIRHNEARAIAAEDASSAKSMFIANMSHELRTPLNAIIGFSEFVATEIMGPIGVGKYREYVQNIMSSGHHLLAIVNNLLLFAKIEAGQHICHLETLRLSDEAGYVLRMLQIEAGNRGVTLECAPVPDTACVTADQQSLRQILLNVVGNALKFSPAGETVRIRVEDAAAGRLRLVVSDSGCGIPPDTLAQIGNPFVQAEGVFARQHQGTGLGLAICFGLAEAMGATITLESTEGQGTVVAVELTAAGDAPEHRRSA